MLLVRPRETIHHTEGGWFSANWHFSFDDYVVTTFNSGVGSSTLPLYIYGRIKFGVTPEINAISTIIVAVVAVALLIGWRFGGLGRDRRPLGIAAE